VTKLAGCQNTTIAYFTHLYKSKKISDEADLKSIASSSLRMGAVKPATQQQTEK